MAQGFTDQAAEKDLFEIEKYIDGMTAFIQSCNTPITISIQGSWGTGKTSLMQIINKKLESNSKIHNIWFNTWQFSQFNLEDKLPLTMLSKLVSAVADKKSGKVKETLVKVFEGIGRLAVGYASGGASNGDEIKELFTEDFVTQLDSLKDSFQDLVDEKAGEDGRVVIFVDDLDRLEPRKAVELLEVLKLFLDCRKCVFVLAIDYDVVCRGVAAKYGESMSDDKGRSFFDKIIQVPFKMPVAEYNIKNYVQDCFTQIGIPCQSEELDIYVDLIKKSIGTNPRSMKRLFNTYLLLKIVVTKEILEGDKNKQLLFAVLCLQHSFDKVYSYVVENRESLTIEDLTSFAEDDYQEINKKLENYEMKENELKRLRCFMKKFLAVIDIDGIDGISEEELENLKNVLGISTITSAGGEEEQNSSIEVTNVGELNVEEEKQEELERLIQKIMAVCPACTSSLRNNKFPHVMFKTTNGKTFADIYMRKNGVSVDCIAKTGKTFHLPEIAELVTKYTLNIINRGAGKYAAFSVRDEEEEDDCLKICKACYDSYMEGNM